ncbi:hypothetical protein BS47DRAFT_1199696 [Hydnum rufescens UP504]|uniref:F-box domain-containing protein n=1 Tax=Hydnum rufescens UP504 TaxID=1448309 RepID=A0A9P6DQL0_9AGAM|nr:hypothetical protein BS47DRAFT_1199696 [Hydnum rufescens UP504]
MDELGDLGGFPIELVLEALNNLAIRDLLRCRRVCKTLKTLIDESIAMQYRVRLALCGYVDGPQSLDGSFSTTASRLEALEAHINRWRHLDWVESRITLPQRPEHNSRRPEHLLAGGMFFDCDSDVLTCIELPSVVRGSPGRIWSHTDFDFRVHSFVADPGQDLLVLVEMLDWDPSLPKKPCEMLVHLRTVSGNTPHPRALTPILSRDGSILPHLLGRLAIMGRLWHLFIEMRVPPKPTPLS